MPRRRLRSLSTPIVLASVAIPIALGLLVGWTLLVVRSEALRGEAWLIALGAVAFAVVVAVLVLFAVFLSREVLEARRQVTFIDSVTHELKSPLASLRMALETLGRDELDEAQRERLRQMALRDVERLSSFIDDVLQASRVVDGELLAERLEEVGLRQLCRKAIDQVLRRRGIDERVVRLDVPESLRLRTDAAALQVVLRNLIDNAVKYSEGRPEDVTVRAGREKDRVWLEVTDRGIGFEPRLRRRIFERFYRADSELVRARHGTGLGLFVVAGIVRRLGGRIEARSEGPGRGATFRVELPARTDRGVAADEVREC